MELKLQNLVAGGDFNVNMDNVGQINRGQRVNTESYPSQLKIVLEEYHLVYVWRRKNQQSTSRTFHRLQYIASLDNFFIPDYLRDEEYYPGAFIRPFHA